MSAGEHIGSCVNIITSECIIGVYYFLVIRVFISYTMKNGDIPVYIPQSKSSSTGNNSP
jgi:hypothetical protein